MHMGMLVRHAGMLAAIKNNLLLNEDSHVARHRRMLVPDNGVLSFSNDFVFASKRNCWDHGE